MANKTIYDLTENQSLDENDLFEQDVYQDSQRKSLKTTLRAIADKIATSLTFSSLGTTSKTLVGAINEAAQGGGGGSLPDYSTTEHQLGRKWIDGKDIWEITYDFSSSMFSIPSGNSFTSTNIDSSNMETMINVFANHNDGTLYNDMSADPTGDSHTKLKLKSVGGASVYYLTLQYTKSS